VASGPEPRKFQEAAAELALERLRDPRGSRRFLVADEVGLGKTIVTSKVIEAMKARARRGLVVVYVCSNREIAEQNRPKLGASDNEQVEVDRLTLLASRTRELRMARRAGAFRLLSITPRTSLEIARNTGRTEERLLILDLLRRHAKVRHTKLSAFMRCQSGPERWRVRARDHGQMSGCSGTLVKRVRSAWREPRADLGGKSVLDALDEALRVPENAWNKMRRKVIGHLRSDLASAVLREVDVDLVVLDEFQRYPEVIKNAGKGPENLAQQLLARAPVLLLSATPYRLYTAGIEKNEHHRELMTLLHFLLKADPSTLGLKTQLDRIAQEIRKCAFLDGDDRQLRAAKAAVEKTLRKVMCRTERNWYVTRRTLPRAQSSDTETTVRELGDYFCLDALTATAKVSRARTLDYWKSAPLPLAFMDAGYELTRKVKKQTVQREQGAPRNLDGLSGRNSRLERFQKAVLENDGGTWRYLWVRPSYLYYEDELFGAQDPRKYLVFSHWRFVPKMLAVSLSHAVGRTLNPLPRAHPLSPRNGRALSILSVSFPSTFLARVVNPLQLTTMTAATPTAEALVSSATKVLERCLTEEGWTLVEQGGANVFTVMAALERSAVLEECESLPADLGTIRRVARTFSRLANSGERRVSRRTLRRLAEIALFSPAVSLLRALATAYGFNPDGGTRSGQQTIRRLLSVCLGTLRLYFNRPTIQKIVRVHGRRGDYVDRVLRYCRRSHVAAMWDEHVALLKSPGQCASMDSALEQVRRVLELGQGTPKLNVVRRGRLHLGVRPATSDYAMAFGEELDSEASQASITQRRTRVREAFNSPFWPFVLATTSVGQEGLDFHLYCQDVVHWNLPTNPVDFEQREGRVNRYAGLWVRRGIARDYPLCASEDGRAAPWPGVFHDAESADTLQKYKHGLFPYWIYEGGSPESETNADGVRRHLVFYRESEERTKYDRLLLAVSLYRLVFGQPNQEELLLQLRDRLERDTDRKRALEMLPSYTINLSPIREGAGLARARRAAKKAATDQEELTRLVTFARGVLLKNFPAVDELNRLIGHVEQSIQERLPPSEEVVAALEYLRDPFDDEYDALQPHGFDDDASVIRAAARTLAGSGKNVRLAA
jgi:hypothetical protein